MKDRKGRLSGEVERIIANWMNPQYMKLHAGEMTAQEVRTARAIVDCVGREIQALLIGNDYPAYFRPAGRAALREGE